LAGRAGAFFAAVGSASANRTCGHIVNVGKQKRNKVLVPRKEWLAKLKAIKAASQATGVDVVIIARTDSIDGALPDREPGGVKAAVERAGVKGFQKLTGTHPRS